MSAHAQPLYVQIAARLRERITNGDYPVGSLLPTEAELGETFATSRNTVREALRRLVELGLIRRRQGAGSMVTSATTTANFVQSFATLEDLFANATNTHFMVNAITKVALAPEIAERIDAETGAAWLLATGVRWTEPGGVPLAYVEAYIPTEFADTAATFWNLRIPFYAALEEASGRTIVEVLQEIRAVAMPRHVANAFGLEEHSLALQLLRRYVTREGTLIASINWHRAHQFTYQMKIARTIMQDNEGGESNLA